MIARSPLHVALRGIDRATGWLDDAVRLVIIAATALIFVLIITQVLFRYVLATPLFWVEELAGYTLAMLALWGSSCAIRHRIHVKVVVLYAMLPRWLKHLVVILVHLVLLYYCWAIGIFGYRFAQLGAIELSPSNAFVLYWPRLLLPTGAVLIAVQTANLILQEIGAWLGYHADVEEAYG